MKKILSIFLFLLTFLSGIISFTSIAHAQVAVVTPPPAATPTNSNCVDGKWCVDPDVTFVGKVAARSGDFLDWTLQNYNWVCVQRDTNGNCNNSNNPLETFWFRIFSIVAAFLGLFILITAFVLIITRGQNLTFRKFIPRIIFVIVFLFLSYSILRVIYVSADAIQGFFLKNPAYDSKITDPTKVESYRYISQGNLLYVGFPYATFEGLRRIGPSYDESAFITLLLTKLTAVTYYAMTGILIIRKIILWFFIIISPIFPILMLYYPVRNTAKIWVGEFFRWLLYAPLFAVLLAGLVALWRSDTPIPLGFVADSSVVYPTAVNILLGGPGQHVSYTSDTESNSVNNKQTFALYAIALIMLWVVILLPFILLQIFLDYLSSISINDNWMAKQLQNNVFNRKSPEPPPKSPVSPGPIRSAGIARPIPFSTGDAKRPATEAARQNRPVQADTEMLRLTNLSVPSMRDIAQYEISRISNNVSKTQEVVSTKDTLTRIADPSKISNSIEREHFQKIQDKLVKESKSGNSVAHSILNAAGNLTHTSISTQSNAVSTMLTQIANPATVTNTVEREKVSELKEKLSVESAKGNQLATIILRNTNTTDLTDEQASEQLKKVESQIKEASAKGDPLAVSLSNVITKEEEEAKATQAAFPVENRVQSVSVEDYEAVRQMWAENYQKLDVPPSVATGRKEWIQGDIAKITHAIDLLGASDEIKKSEGMEAVSGILPFLLIGGFSHEEVITYLKAKLAAAKAVLATTLSSEQEQESLVDTKQNAQEKPKVMTMEAAEPEKTEDVPTTNNDQKKA